MSQKKASISEINAAIVEILENLEGLDSLSRIQVLAGALTDIETDHRLQKLCDAYHILTEGRAGLKRPRPFLDT